MQSSSSNMDSFLKELKGKFEISIKTGDEFIFDNPFISLFKKYFKCTIKDYIFHKDVGIVVSPKNIKIVLFVLQDEIILTEPYTDRSLYTKNPIISKIDYKTIYSVVPGVKDKHNLLDLNIITSDNLSSLQTMSFSFKIQRDVIIAKHFIDKQRTLKWQNYFESTIPIDPPCYYQGHFFIQKINSRGKSQNRAIVFSNKVIIDIL